MNILIAIDNLGRGGRERRALELIKGLLDTCQFELSLVIFSDLVEYEEVYELGIQIFKLPRKPKKDPKGFFRFFNICRKIKPDLVHTWGDMASIYAVPATVLLGIKLINGSVDNAPANTGWSDPEFYRKKLLSPFCHSIIGNSRAGLKAYRIAESKARYIPNGFNFNRLNKLRSSEEVRAKLSISTEKVIGMVGAFEDRKDYYCYLEAAKIVLDRGYKVSFLAIGEGSHKQEYQSTLKKKYKRHILFPGLQKEIESIIQLFDIGVLLTNSDIHGEGISNSILEYMASGKAVIATDTGGSSEIIQQNKTGFLLPPKSVELVASCMIHLLENPELARQMGEKGKKRIQDHFSLQRMTDTYMEHYHEALNLPYKAFYAEETLESVLA